MNPGRRLPWPLIAGALALAATISGGAILIMVVPWLLYIAGRHGQLRGCLITGCVGYLALSLIVGLLLMRAGRT